MGLTQADRAKPHLEDGVTAREAHMTADGKVVRPGAGDIPQRRAGVHLDGQFIQAESRWKHPTPKSRARYCNPLTVERIEVIVEVIVEAIRTASVPGRTVYDGIFRGKIPGRIPGKTRQRRGT